MLQNWPIRSKLVVILVVPLAALAVLSAIQVRGNVDNVRVANRIKALADFSIKSNDLVQALQVERYATNSYVGSNYMAVAQGQAALAARGPVDQALAVYRAGEAALPAAGRDTLATTLVSILERLGKLPAQRKAIDAHQAQVDQNIAFYLGAVDDLLALNAQVAAGSRNTSLVNGATALVSIAQAKEQVAHQRGAVVRVILLQQTDVATLREIQTRTGAEDAWLAQFRTTATADEQEFYNVTVGRTISAAGTLRDGTVNAVQNGQPLTVTPQIWLQASDAKINAMRQVERRVAADLGTASANIASSATRDALVSGIGVALVLVVSVVISLLVASPMIRDLRRLRRGALEVANERLPGVVDRLHRGSPVDVAEEEFPVEVRSKDEIGQLAEAFGTVHAVAVRTAVEQAAMRKSIGDTFLNLARRSQALIHRQLKVIDALERKETDPDELEELFRLDHLATRMRRHAEDLIVLSGSKPARGWRRPVPVKDVVRGAVAEVEDYTRVQVMSIDGGAISGHAVGDVIHMLAELIENATSFSPPHTPVHVSGHEVSNGFVIEIEDRGLGMSPEEFDAVNERLANPPPFDLSTSERLGLFVVGRLAERHSISVKLRSSPYGGTMAIVLVPTTLLRQVDPDGEARPEPTQIAPPLAMTRVPALDGPAIDEDRFRGSLVDADGDLAGPPALSEDAAAAAHGQDETLIDDLPVFATVRSSWFVADRPRHRSNGRRSDAPPRPLTPRSDPDSGPGEEPGSRGFGTPPPLPSRRSRGGRRAAGDQPHQAVPDHPQTPGLDDPDGPPARPGQDESFRDEPFPEEPFRDGPLRDGRDVPGPGGHNGAPGSGYGGDGGPGGRVTSLFGDSPMARERSRGGDLGSADPGEATRTDPFTSPLGRPVGYSGGFHREDAPAMGQTVVPLGRPAPSARSDESAESAGPGADGQPPVSFTEVGLPKRTRRASLAPQLRRDIPEESSGMLAAQRSPEEIRSMMSSFQNNFGRGLADGQVSNDGDDVGKVT
ncbi:MULTISPECIES: sensor histidine kinase [unclassified Frankia]